MAEAYLKKRGGSEPIRAGILVGEGEYYRLCAEAFMNDIQDAEDAPPIPRRFEAGAGKIETSLQALLEWEVELLFSGLVPFVAQEATNWRSRLRVRQSRAHPSLEIDAFGSRDST